MRRHPFGMAKNSRLEIQGELCNQGKEGFEILISESSLVDTRSATGESVLTTLFSKVVSFSECTLTRFSRNRLTNESQ